MKIYTAYEDPEDISSIILTQATKHEVDTPEGFKEEGQKLAQWLAWNSTAHFHKTFMAQFAEEYAFMRGCVEDDSIEYELDDDGFPVINKAG